MQNKKNTNGKNLRILVVKVGAGVICAADRTATNCKQIRSQKQQNNTKLKI
jgi:hypothetical protein